MTLKKFITRAGIVVLTLTAIIFICMTAAYNVALRKPSVKFLLSNSDFRTPKEYVRKEILIDVGREKVPFMMYRHTRVRSDVYYFFQFGITPDGNRHPKLDRMAASLCDATGMTVMIPSIPVAIIGDPLKHIYTRLGDLYVSLVKQYPGRYRAFGACIGANVLLVALNRVPREIYPKKMLLLGPFTDGKSLFKFYNTLVKPEEIDLMVKMAVTLNMDAYTDAEKKLIKKAIASSGQGTTDRSKIKKILGERLFNDITVVKLRYTDFEEISPRSMFGNSRPPDCKYFILHSLNDNIIPYFEGKNLASFMKKSGISANFMGTELLSHTENRTTVTGFVTEMKYLVLFFDELFEGDVSTY